MLSSAKVPAQALFNWSYYHMTQKPTQPHSKEFFSQLKIFENIFKAGKRSEFRQLLLVKLPAQEQGYCNCLKMRIV